MDQPVFASLLPVVFLIGAGVLARRRGWISGQGVKELSNLAFLLLAPALLFRTMATVRLEQMELRPIATYFIGAGVIFAATLLLRGLNRRAVVLALAGTYSNAVMIGIPLVGLAYGEAGLVPLFTLISMHAVVMLTLSTVLLELSVAREERAAGLHAQRSMAHTVALAVRNAIIHPVPLPIIAGLLFAQTGLVMPEGIDTSLKRPLPTFRNRRWRAFAATARSAIDPPSTRKTSMNPSSSTSKKTAPEPIVSTRYLSALAPLTCVNERPADWGTFSKVIGPALEGVPL